MLQKKYIIIGIVILLLVIGITAFMISQKQQGVTQVTPTSSISSGFSQKTTPAPLVTAESVLTLSYADESHKAINVLIDTGNNRVRGAKTVLTYPTNSFSTLIMAPGDFFAEPIVYVEKIDNEKLQIIYGLGVEPGKTGKKGTGILATFTLNSATEAAVFKPQFSPDTVVTAEGTDKSVLKTVNNL